MAGRVVLIRSELLVLSTRLAECITTHQKGAEMGSCIKSACDDDDDYYYYHYYCDDATYVESSR